MPESENYRRRRELLETIDAEMLRVHETVLFLLRRGGAEDAFDVRTQVASSLGA